VHNICLTAKGFRKQTLESASSNDTTRQTTIFGYTDVTDYRYGVSRIDAAGKDHLRLEGKNPPNKSELRRIISEPYLLTTTASMDDAQPNSQIGRPACAKLEITRRSTPHLHKDARTDLEREVPQSRLRLARHRHQRQRWEARCNSFVAAGPKKRKASKNRLLSEKYRFAQVFHQPRPARITSRGSAYNKTTTRLFTND